MINEKRKLKREHSNKMLKTISFSCPPEVLLIGNGLNRLLGLSSWQALNELLKENGLHGIVGSPMVDLYLINVKK